MKPIGATSAKLALSAILAACAAPMMAAEMPFQGSTTGSFTDSTTATLLPFTGTNFGPSTTSGGSATLTDLGTFTVALPSSGTFGINLGDFNLTITFTIPDGANPTNPIVAAVTGTINTQNANNVFINFGAGQNINYSGSDGSGSFFLTVNDVSFQNGSKTEPSLQLTGSIGNAVYNPPTVPPGSTVPEPGTLALLGLGLAGLAASRRRKQ